MNHGKEINDILTFWFPNNIFNNFWFDKSCDQEIKHKFHDLLKKAEKKEFDNWTKTHKSVLALIILLDQFSRNIYITNFRRNDEYAFKIAEKIISSGKDLDYPLNQRIFIYLPYRHQNNSKLLDILITKLENIDYTSLCESDKIIFDKFWKATLKNYSKVTDNIIKYTKNPDYIYNLLDDISILDTNCIKYNNKHAEIPNNKTKIYIEVKNFLQIHKIKNIGVSLSGGVDSVVLLFILKQMLNENIIDALSCYHVNYNNREESGKEMTFVINLSNYLDIPIYTVSIENMQRNDPGLNTTFYETVTKDIRFNLYNHGIHNENLTHIVLGHHKDDIIENILMNIFRGKNILNLIGMMPIQQIKSINITRPLLNIHKKDIYNIAHEYNIPYLKDTTSKTCYRGYVRSMVQNLNSYDNTSLDNILKIGMESMQFNSIMNNLIENTYNNIEYCKYGYVIPIDEKILEMPKIFWENIISKLLHENGYKMISKKTMDVLLQNIKYRNRELNTFELSKELLGAFVWCNGFYLYIIKKDIFDTHNIHEKYIDISQENEIVLNEKITIKIEDAYYKDRSPKINLKNIINGEYKYLLHEIPSENCTKLHITYSKKDKNLKRYFDGLHNISKNIIKVKPENIQEKSEKTFLVTIKF